MKAVVDMKLDSDGNQSLTVGGGQTMTITNEQSISAEETDITNDVNVTGTLDASVNVLAGSTNIPLDGHKHLANNAGSDTGPSKA